MSAKNFKPFFLNSNLSFGRAGGDTVENLLRPAAGNSGNSYITYALVKTVLGDFAGLSHIANVYEYDFSASERDAEFARAECTHVFLVLQDQIRIEESYGLRLPYENIVSFLKKCGKPVVIAGLGANSFGGFDPEFHKKLPPALVKFLREISGMCEKIGVRGEFTADVLAKLGISNFQIIGCPSFFETGPGRRVEKPPFGELNPVLTSPLVYRAENAPAVMQDFLEKGLINLSVFGKFTEEIRLEDYRRAKCGDLGIFFNPEKWKAFLGKYNFALEPRVHGSIAAINAGLPAVCTNTDSRAAEMCAFLKIPRLADDSFVNYAAIPNARNFADFIKRAYEACDTETINAAYPKLFENYKNFITSQGLPFNSGKCANSGLLSDIEMRGPTLSPPAAVLKLSWLECKRLFRRLSRSAAKRLLKRNRS